MDRKCEVTMEVSAEVKTGLGTQTDGQKGRRAGKQINEKGDGYCDKEIAFKRMSINRCLARRETW